jgi:hypothetical protein
VSLVVTYVPAEAADRVRSAMGDAGAGRVGSYKDSSFSHDGHGRFVAGELSHPVNGVMGANTVAEVCIEMTCPVPFTTRVLSAARDAHPYESPVVFASEVQMSRVGFGLGCVCPIDPPTDRRPYGSRSKGLGRSGCADANSGCGDRFGRFAHR